MSGNPVSFASEAHGRILQIAALPAVHRAFQWLHLQELRIRQWQRDVVAIPAPPFGEAARAQWFLEAFRDLHLQEAHLDEVGNALAWWRAPVAGEPLILLSAHLDTVFPADTPLMVREENTVLHAPGACDNGAGLAGLLALVAAMRHADIAPATNLLVAANVGEEAEGDLRGMRHIFGRSAVRDQIIGSLALEGAGTGTVVTRGLGSRRFQVEITGPGGHAWTDAAIPNPVVALARAVTALMEHSLPLQPRTVINVGRMEGGRSITGVPERATALVDIRSTDGEQILLREVQLFRAVEDAVIAANRGVAGPHLLAFEIRTLGDRPAGELAAHAPLRATVRAVDRHLRLPTEERIGSTDANIPIALGLNAIAMGAGGTAAGIHTTSEWYNSAGRELALRRILLVLLDMTGKAFLEQVDRETSSRPGRQPFPEPCGAAVGNSSALVSGDG